MAKIIKLIGGFNSPFSSRAFRALIALFCAVLLASGDFIILAQAEKKDNPQDKPQLADEDTGKIPNDQLDSLVAPIALYPDPLLSQTLVASTYPLEIIQLQQWLEKNKNLKEKELEEAVKKQDWDPSIQAMASLPDVVKRLADDIKWTTDLGNAFLAQQSDVMDAVQRMRKKAQEKGTLKSTEQQKVETKEVESKTVVVIEQADPQVIYVPSYDPVVVYGPPLYPYPPIYYPPPGYYATGMFVSFSMGVMMGAAWGGGWGYGCGWGHNDVNININNNYVSHYNKQNNIRGSGNNNWQHNPEHRGGAPYSNKKTASQYGGTAKGDSMSTRQTSARQQAGQKGSKQQAGTMDRGAGSRSQASSMDRRAASPSSASRGSASGDRIGNQSVSRSPSANNRSAFSGGSGGMSGGSARASSSRGYSSMRGSRGGGGGRGRR